MNYDKNIVKRFKPHILSQAVFFFKNKVNESLVTIRGHLYKADVELAKSELKKIKTYSSTFGAYKLESYCEVLVNHNNLRSQHIAELQDVFEELVSGLKGRCIII